MWPLLSQLDGHADSGRVAPESPTRQKAAAYIAERIAAHDRFHRQRRRKARYLITRSSSGKFSWTLRDEGGGPVASSPSQYPSQAAAEAAIAKVRDLGPFAPQTAPAAKAKAKAKTKAKAKAKAKVKVKPARKKRSRSA